MVVTMGVPLMMMNGIMIPGIRGGRATAGIGASTPMMSHGGASGRIGVTIASTLGKSTVSRCKRSSWPGRRQPCPIRGLRAPGLQPVFEEPAEGGEQAPKAKVEPRVEPKVEPPPQKPSKGNPAENGKSWNTDKFGKILNGKALYQRFYRSIRSPLACNKKPAAA